MLCRISLCVGAVVTALACATTATAAAPLIVSPGVDAVLTHSPIGVGVRASGPVTATRVLINGRDRTSSLRASRGRLTGRLSRRNGLRYGRNTLVVVEVRRGRRVVRAARVFFLLRRDNGFARLTLGRGVPLGAQLDLRPSGRREPARQIRVWLNRAEVTRDTTRQGPTRFTLSLSATHGLRFGANRLRVLVTEPQTGRYASIARRFRVRRDRPLASAGRDRATRSGEPVRLGGHAAAARGATILRYRWVLVRRPRGSHARLFGAARAHPLIVPDRPGRYVVSEYVAEYAHTRGATRQVGPAGADQIVLSSSPSSALLPVWVNAFPINPRRIQLGDVAYDHPGKGATIQWLTLDRATLEPVGTGNTWCCEDQGGPSLASLTRALQKPTADELVVIAVPPGRITLGPGQYAAFNHALALIGVRPLSAAQLSDSSRQLVILGIPNAPIGTGWVWQRTAPALAPLVPSGTRAFPPPQGWLMPDGTQTDSTQRLLLRFEPPRLSFNTQSLTPASPTQNTMTIAGVTTAVASIPAGTGGFQVVEIDPHDLSMVTGGDRTFVTNGTPMADDNLDAMASFLDGIRARSHYAAVQSIGNIGFRSRDWGAVSASLAKLGANPHGFNSLDPAAAGHFAFFGGPPLGRNEVAESTSNLLVGTTSQQRQPGSLRGRARMRHSGIFAPVFDDATVAGGAVYDAVFRPSTPWPHTHGPEAPAYAAAMKYVTSQLTDFVNYAPDLRMSYLERAFLGTTDTSYGDSLSQLAGLKYPGDGNDCNQSAGPNRSNPGYTRDQFCDLVHELGREFRWIDGTRTLFASYEQALDRSQKATALDLVTEGEAVNGAVRAGNYTLATSFLYLLADIADVGGAEGAPFGVFASLFDVGSDIASDSDGAPTPDRIQTRVNDLGAAMEGEISQTEDAMDSVRAVAISDYGRLSRLGPLALATNASVPDLVARLKLGADRYFATSLMRVAYVPWQLEPVSPSLFTLPMSPDKCFVTGDRGPAQTWGHVAEASWLAFASGPNGQANDWETLALAADNVFGAGDTPPESLTGKMFGPSVGGSAYGLEKSAWFWQLGNPVRFDTCFPFS